MERPDQQEERWHTPDQLFLASPYLISARRRGDYMNYGVRLYQAALKGEWEVARQILDAYPDSINAGITKHGDTILHIAAAATRTKFVEELVSKMSPENLGTQNRMGNTALCLAAVSGDVSIAKAMVEANQGLPSIRGHSNFTPVQMAALLGHRDMVDYLLPLTTGFTNADLMALLTATVNTDLYDIALCILKDHPDLAIARDEHQQTPLHILARKSPKSCRAQLGFWTRFCNFFTGLDAVEKENPLPTAASELVECLCKIVLMKPEAEISNLIGKPTNLLFEAAKAGNVEFLRILIRSYPDLIWQCDSNRMTIFHVAVEYRQEKVFRLIHELGAIKGLLAISVNPDNLDNMLHLAARLPSSDRLNRISGAVFQMQREIQWFKVVEDLVQPEYAESENLYNETPRVLFTEQHNELRKKGEKWMRISAASYSVVATLIVTMVFSAGSKIISANDRERYMEYYAFGIFDAVSLVYSTASILVFLSIMTSRYAEDDFLESLPNKLLIGLILLVLAIATMMMAFFTIFYINFKSHLYFLWIVLLGLPGLLMIVIFLLRDSLFLVYRLVARRNILRQPLYPGLLHDIDLAIDLPLPVASNLAGNPINNRSNHQEISLFS